MAVADRHLVSRTAGQKYRDVVSTAQRLNNYITPSGDHREVPTKRNPIAGTAAVIHPSTSVEGSPGNSFQNCSLLDRNVSWASPYSTSVETLQLRPENSQVKVKAIYFTRSHKNGGRHLEKNRSLPDVESDRDNHRTALKKQKIGMSRQWWLCGTLFQSGG